MREVLLQKCRDISFESNNSVGGIRVLTTTSRVA
jgi:hypothetical protein